MPVSKKPRKKAPPPPITADLVPDIAAMDRYLASTSGDEQASALEQAQDLTYDASDAASERGLVKACLRALAISPLCADAYNILAGAATTPKRKLALFTLGMEAGQRALGPETFRDYSGQFWGWLGTRPYMRARAGVAITLLLLNRDEEAIEHINAMLDLNPNDNQGMRYVLMAALLQRMDFDAVRALLDRYGDEDSMQFSLTRALLLFREGGDAQACVAQATEWNKHVVPMLTGQVALIRPDLDMMIVGGPDEAAQYVIEYGSAWRKTDGALGWLAKAAADLPPKS